MQKINQKYINNVVKKALLEDLSPKEDVTTNLLNSKNKIIKAKIIAKQNGIISGLDFCKTAFKLIGKETVFKQKIKDGKKIKKNKIIAEIKAKTKTILIAESYSAEDYDYNVFTEDSYNSEEELFFSFYKKL